MNKLQDIKTILDLSEVMPAYLHLSPQIWSVREWQGQKGFINLSSCLLLLPEHLWAVPSVQEASQRSMKLAKGSASSSHYSQPQLSHQDLQFWVAGEASKACPSPSQPSLHMGQSLEQSTFQTEKHSMSTSSALSRQHFGEFYCHFLRKSWDNFECPYRELCLRF